MLCTSLNSLFRVKSSEPQPIFVFSPPRSHLNSFPSALIHFFCTLVHLEEEENYQALGEIMFPWEDTRDGSKIKSSIVYFHLISLLRLTLELFCIRNVKQMCDFCSACTNLSPTCTDPFWVNPKSANFFGKEFFR